MPLTIELFLNRATSSDLQNWLVQKLDVSSPDALERMNALLAQDPKITSTRERLNAEIAKLKNIQRELRGLRLSDHPEPGDSGAEDKRGYNAIPGQNDLASNIRQRLGSSLGSSVACSGIGKANASG